jgi:endo-1,4-beta-D-glucanase Y
MSNIEVKTSQNAWDRIKDIVENAREGFKESFFKKNGRNATVDEVQTFCEEVAGRVAVSITKSNPEAEKARRASAMKAVNEVAELNGVKFVHRREVATVLDKESNPKIGSYDLLKFVESTRGGATIAFKYSVDDKNDLYIVYAVAFCRTDENFDPLIGKQESLKKFMNGQVIVASITHEPFGPVKLNQLDSAYKTYENAEKAKQPK